MTALPLFHSYAMTTCMNLGTLIASTLLLIPDPRDLEDVLKSITKHRPTQYPDELPKTMLGKVLRRVLAEEERKGQTS